MTGSKDGTTVADDEMLARQEEIMSKINKERLDFKEVRESK